MNYHGNLSLRNDALIALLLFIFSLALFSLGWPFCLGGVTDAAAQRVLAGEIPYRDYWTLYAPGSFYFHALLMKIFGSHVLVGAVAASVITAMAVSSCYLLVSGWLQRPGSALACAALFFAANFAKSYYLSLGPYPPTILLILLTLICINLYYQREQHYTLFAAGLLSGLTIVFKHDVAGYTGLAIAAGLIAFHLGGDTTQTERFRSLLKALAVYAAGAALIALPVAVYFAIKAGTDMWQDLIIFPLIDFRYARIENYPSLLPVGLYHHWKLRMAFKVFNYIAFLLPFLITISAAMAIAATLVKRSQWHTAFGITFVIAWLLHFISAHVQINTNFISMTLYASLLGAMLYDWMLKRHIQPGKSGLFRAAVPLLVTCWFIVIVAQPAYNLAANYRENVAEMQLPRVSGMRMKPREHQEFMFLANYVNKHVPHNQKVFLSLHRHDVTIVSHSNLYVILEKMNPTRHDQLHPGVVEREDIQRQIIEDLEGNAVSVIILQHIFNDEKLDKLKIKRMENLPESGATVLDEYIQTEFYLADSFDRYEIWRRVADDMPKSAVDIP